MKERIIVAGGISEVELLRTLSRNGVNTFALRVMSPVDLCEYALIKAGYDIPKRLNSLDCTGIILSILKRGDNPYFASSTTFRDARRVYSSLNLLRGLVTETDEEKGLEDGLCNGAFPEKNKAVLKLYKDYIYAMRNLGLDDIALIRRTLSSGSRIDAELIILDEYKLSPLEEKAVSVLGGNVRKASLLSFYEEKDSGCSECYIKAYGEGNEVESVISAIYRNNLPLDECVIASANPSLQSLLFSDLAKLHNIPLTLSTGLPLSLSAPASLLSAMIEWNTFGYNGKDAWKALVDNDGFNDWKFKSDIALGDLNYKVFIEMVGKLRISFASDNTLKLDEYERSLRERLNARSKERQMVEKKMEFLEPMRKLVSIMECGFIDFFDLYAVIRRDEEEFDSTAKKRIIETLRSYYESSGHKEDYENILEDILLINVGRKTSQCGALHFTTIKDAMISMRKNVFVTGLSSAEFPGAPIQDYLALDDDIMLLTDSAHYTSAGRIEERISSLDSLKELAEKTAERVFYSYSSYDTAELKDCNPSSWLYSRMKDEGKEMGYFSSGLTPAFSSGLDYINGELNMKSQFKMKEDIRKDGIITSTGGEIRRLGWSATSLEAFLTECPRRFYLASVVGIPDDSPDNPLETMRADAFGTLVHYCIENYSFGAITIIRKDEFLYRSSLAFDNAIKERPPVNAGDIEYLKKEFLETMDRAYDINYGDSRPLSSETELLGRLDDFIVSGYPDRIALADPPGLTVIDFKTSTKVFHKVKGNARGVNKNPYVSNEDKYRHCFQVLLYAWLYNRPCSKDDLLVQKCEYRYPCVEGDDARVIVDFSRDPDFDLDSYIEGKLRIVKEALEANDSSYFPRNESNCKYCNLKAYCKWPGDAEEIEENEEDE